MASQETGWDDLGKSLLAGGLAGGISRTAVAPLERLKIVLQVQGNEKVYTGVWQGLVKMAKSEGVRGLMKGNGTNCIRIIPNSAVKFLTYEKFKQYLSAYKKDQIGDGKLTPGLRLLAGAGAGIVGMTSTYPLDMVRGRLTVQEGTSAQYRGIAHAATDIFKKEGLLAFYRGWLPSVIGVVPYAGLNFGVYETSKVFLLNYHGVSEEADLGTVEMLGCGALAGLCGQTMAYPFDVARRRLQVSGWQGAAQLHGDSVGHAVAYKGMVDCFKRTVQEEGVQALFKGLWPNYLKVIPSIAIMFVCYEKIKSLVGAKFVLSS
ncbi:hypothetical protein BSKO_03864 [Bryopsis sp. KO-2023]|nr:hypothetical protein BSKO_03864 [Bryopsis sp. KO-2023]